MPRSRSDSPPRRRARSRSPRAEYQRDRSDSHRSRPVRVERFEQERRERRGVRTEEDRQKQHVEEEKIRNPKTVRQLEASRAALLEDSFGYTKENPFGDQDLAKPFVWSKKVIHDANRGVYHDTKVDAMMDKTVEKVREIEEVRKRRVDRERQEDELEETRALKAREKAQENYNDWREKEEQFAKGVAMDRVAYRLETGREGHLELVLKAFIMANYDSFDYVPLKSSELHNCPLHGLVHGLTIGELSELNLELNIIIETIKGTIAGQAPKDRSLKFISTAEGIDNPYEDPSLWPMTLRKALLQFLDAFQSLMNYAARDKGVNVHGMAPALELGREAAPEVAKFFNGQTVEELRALKPEVESAAKTATDTNFFEGVLDLIPYYIARGICERVMQGAGKTLVAIEQERLHELRQKRREEEEAKKVERLHKVYEKNLQDAELAEKAFQEASEYELKKHTLASLAFELMKRLIDETKDYSDRKDDRKEKLIIYKARQRGRRKIAPEIQDNERKKTADLKPRKPRFENRVRTGYDWNRYNQTHYDINNPPPKMVLGYKFNIYYPDLIDKSVTPSWTLEPCTDGDGHENTVQLRFTAGPPYEDIAFRILNREWDTHSNAHFVNKFEKGVLQLHFSLKRMRYRK